MRFIVCAVGDWNKDIFFESCERFEGDVGLATCPDELVSYEKDPTPEFIFFLALEMAGSTRDC